jgi:hypothetical protein
VPALAQGDVFFDGSHGRVPRAMLAAHAIRIAGAHSASFSATCGVTTRPSSESSVSTSTSSSSMSGIVSERRSGRLPQVTTPSTGVPNLRDSAIARLISGERNDTSE